MKLKTKFLIIIAIAFFTVLIGITNVKAETYTHDFDYGYGLKGTITTTIDGNKIIQKNSYYNTIVEYENLGEVIGVDGSAFVMKQEEINKYVKDKDIQYTVKTKVGNDVESATTLVDRTNPETSQWEMIDGEKMEIEVIDNEKWVVYSGTIHYEGRVDYPLFEVTGSKNKDIATVYWMDYIRYYTNENKDNVQYINIDIDCVSEAIAGCSTVANGSIVNKRDVALEQYGGGGSGPDGGYTWLYPIYNAKGYSLFSPTSIPINANLSEIYMKISVKYYQGEKIELSDNKGTLYYERKVNDEFYGIMYVYKNALSNLKIEEYEMPVLDYKLENGLVIPNIVGVSYKLDENAKEEVVEVNDSTKNDQDIKDEIGITYWGDAKFDSIEIDKNDSIYSDVKDNLEKNSTDYKNRLYLDIMDIYRVSGDYGGKLTITFSVGEQYNGKYYFVSHRVNHLNYEHFEGIVENGKITITVDSLSPFGISIYEDKQTNDVTDKGELDETPKTGTVDIISYVSIATIVSMIGAVVLKKKLK